jgi:hypothetical protein
VNFIRSSSVSGWRGDVGGCNGLTSPEEKRFAGDTSGEGSDELIGGVDDRYAVDV